MTLLPPNNLQSYFTKSARLPLLTAVEREEHVSELTNARASLDLSEKADSAIEVSSGMIDAAYYIFDADFPDFEELHEAGTRE